MKLAADENFDGDLLRGLRRRKIDIDVVRIQDSAIAGAKDSVVLSWSAAEGRILLTHDRVTIPALAFERIRLGQPMPSVFLVSDQMPKGKAIEEVLLAIQCLTPEECQNPVVYMPLT